MLIESITQLIEKVVATFHPKPVPVRIQTELDLSEESKRNHDLKMR